jgi:hypothetical protein
MFYYDSFVQDIVVNYNGLGDYWYEFGDCIPFNIDGSAANSAQVNKFAKCYGYSYVDRVIFNGSDRDIVNSFMQR